MRAEDFSVWLCGVARLSADQRRKALAALANLDGGRHGSAPKAASETAANGGTGKGAEGAKRRRPDALGTSGHERVESQGCPHCAGREVIACGRSGGLSRFRCKGCGRTFNALTKTPMAHLRKRERWLDHARAMIDGKSLSKTAELCGMHPTTAFRWRHRFLASPAADKPRTLTGIVEADETFILESCKGRWSATGWGRLSTPSCRRPTALRSARRWLALSHAKTTWSATEAGRSPPSPAKPKYLFMPCPRRENRPRRRPTCTSTTSTPTTAASSNGSAVSTASPPRTCQTISAGDARSKPGPTKPLHKTGSKAPSEMGHTNN